jgi:hypothetical protein
MTSSIRFLAAAATVSMLLAGCAGDGEDTSSAPTTSAPTTSASPAASAAGAVSWAAGVCTASQSLRASTDGLTEAVPVQLGADTTAREQARKELSNRVAAVDAAARELRTAVSSLPPDADPALVAAKGELETASTAAADAVTDVRSEAAQVTAATDAAALAAAVPGMASAVATASAAVTAFREELRTLRTSAGTAVRQAFQSAPECATATASP